MKGTQFEKTGSKRRDSIALGNLIIKDHIRNLKSIAFFVSFTLLLLDNGVCLPFNNGNALDLERNPKSNREKSKLSVNKFS